jgi:hypothetical protein
VPQFHPAVVVATAAAIAVAGRLVALALALAMILGACGVVSTTPPVATPADFVGITSELANRGVAVNRFVSGDAGCADPVLTPTAIAFDAKGLDQAENVRIYIYIFRNREAFERLRASVDACAVSFVTDPSTFESVEESPFVLAGQGPWGAGFEVALREGLAAAAGTGG